MQLPSESAKQSTRSVVVVIAQTTTSTKPKTFLMDLAADPEWTPGPDLPAAIGVGAVVSLDNETVTVVGQEYMDDNQV